MRSHILTGHRPRRGLSKLAVVVALIAGVICFFFVGILSLVGVAFFARMERAEVMRRDELRRLQSERGEVMRRFEQAPPAEVFPRPVEGPEMPFADGKLHSGNRPHPKVPHAKIVPARPVEAVRVRQPIRVANREILVCLDAQGKIQVDDKPVKQGQLLSWLRDASRGRETALIITIRADKRCPFEHVAAVLSACQELDIPNVRIDTQ